jgi:hypothetical protein
MAGSGFLWVVAILPPAINGSQNSVQPNTAGLAGLACRWLGLQSASRFGGIACCRAIAAGLGCTGNATAPVYLQRLLAAFICGFHYQRSLVALTCGVQLWRDVCSRPAASVGIFYMSITTPNTTFKKIRSLEESA